MRCSLLLVKYRRRSRFPQNMSSFRKRLRNFAVEADQSQSSSPASLVWRLTIPALRMTTFRVKSSRPLTKPGLPKQRLTRNVHRWNLLASSLGESRCKHVLGACSVKKVSIYSAGRWILLGLLDPRWWQPKQSAQAERAQLRLECGRLSCLRQYPHRVFALHGHSRSYPFRGCGVELESVPAAS